MRKKLLTTTFFLTFLIMALIPLSIVRLSYSSPPPPTTFYKRVSFVYSDPTSYLDEYAFLASIPANVFWAPDGTVYSAPIIFGESKAGRYLLEDWKTYCNRWGGIDNVDYIGPYSSNYISTMQSYLGASNYVQVTATDPYSYAMKIALRDWVNSTTAVVAPAQTYFVPSNTIYGSFQGSYSNVVPGTYTVNVPFTGVVSPNGWFNSTFAAYSNATNIQIIPGLVRSLAIPPFYSGLMLTNETFPQGPGLNVTFVQAYLIDNTSKVVDYSWNTPGWRWESTGWTGLSDHIVSANGNPGTYTLAFYSTNSSQLPVNVTGTVQFDMTAHRYNITVPQNAESLRVHLNISDPAYYNFGASYVRLALIDPDGNEMIGDYYKGETFNYIYNYVDPYNVVENPAPGNWTAIVWCLPSGSLTGSTQYNLNYAIQGYPADKTKYVGSAANGAVIASLQNSPLLYTASNSLPDDTATAINRLGVTNVILVGLNNTISTTVKNSLTSLGVTIAADLINMTSVCSYIRSISNQPDIAVTIPEDNFFAAAALVGAYHGGPVLLLEGKGKTVSNIAESVWGRLFASLSTMTGWYVAEEYKSAHFIWMYELSDTFYSWINGLGLDAPGAETVITVAPMDRFMTTFDRAIVGGSITGRLAGDTAEEDVAFECRAMLYPAIVYANPGYTDATMSLVAYEHGWQIYDNLNNSINVFLTNITRDALNSTGFNITYHIGKYEILSELNNGTAIWSFSDHGDLGPGYDRRPFAEGWLGVYSNDSAWRAFELGGTVNSPDFDGNDVVDPLPLSAGGFITSNIIGSDFDAFVGNIHSTIVDFMCCWIGSSKMPVTVMKHGAVASLGSLRLLDFGFGYASAMFVNRTVLGDTLGEAMMYVLTACSWNYYAHQVSQNFSNWDPILGHLSFMRAPAFGGGSLQYVLHGDPEVQLINPNTWSEPQGTGVSSINVGGHSPERGVGEAPEQPPSAIDPVSIGIGLGVGVAVGVIVMFSILRLRKGS